MFNCRFISDTIKLFRKVEPEAWTEVDLIRTGIAWDADKKYKFKNPSLGDKPPTPENLKAGNWLFILSPAMVTQRNCSFKFIPLRAKRVGK